MCRPAPASWRTPILLSSSTNASTSRRHCSAPPRRRAASPAPQNAGSRPSRRGAAMHRSRAAKYSITSSQTGSVEHAPLEWDLHIGNTREDTQHLVLAEHLETGLNVRKHDVGRAGRYQVRGRTVLFARLDIASGHLA